MNLPEQLTAWRNRHQIAPEAFAELWYMLHAPVGGTAVGCEGMGEAATQQRIRLESVNCAMNLYRNNVGALTDSRGIPVRYGLCNDSKQLNDRVKSSDLIGWTRHIISPADVGRMVAIFTAVETKAGNWVYKGTPHEVAQARFHTLVRSAGGFAGFARSPADLQGIVK